jgi:hypothetical protein
VTNRYGKTITVTLDEFGAVGEWIEITNPMWLRQKDLAKLQGAENDPEVMAGWIASLIHGWNVTDIDGNAVPSIKDDPENINELPLIVIRKLGEVIRDSLQVPLGIATPS